ncbi:DUF1492 domain-containing protein [Eubacteriales bacterium OttesenSCG-928-A19]|nr:DUF1492 domain-containing protein [Eubacteriales bacterium OttesenSCG-928-A19]
MTAKEYLSQVRQLDQRINCKLDQISSLHSLATKATTTLSDFPRNDTPNPHSMENIIVKLVDLEADINAEVDKLVDLKREILEVIQAVHTPEYQALLEMRYLGFMSWSVIAEIYGYDTRSAYREHRNALRAVESVLRKKEMDTQADACLKK